jgi:putative hydrolase of the HAD superfamily
MHLQGICAVAFDAVGTLIYPSPAAPAVYAKIGHRFGSKLPLPVIAKRFKAAFKQEEEWDKRQEYRTSEAREVERWLRIVTTVLSDAQDPDACFRELFEHFARPESWSCNPGVREVLERFKDAGYKLAIASNYDSRLRGLVTGIAALRPLTRQVISSEVGWRKPSPQFFAAICEAVGAEPAEILYVGDDLVNDYKGAADAGLKVMLYDPQQTAASLGIPRIGHLNDLLEIPQ